MATSRKITMPRNLGRGSFDDRVQDLLRRCHVLNVFCGADVGLVIDGGSLLGSYRYESTRNILQDRDWSNAVHFGPGNFVLAPHTPNPSYPPWSGNPGASSVSSVSSLTPSHVASYGPPRLPPLRGTFSSYLPVPIRRAPTPSSAPSCSAGSSAGSTPPRAPSASASSVVSLSELCEMPGSEMPGRSSKKRKMMHEDEGSD